VSDLHTFRARIFLDLIYQASKPLSSPQLTMVTNRSGTYLRTGAVESLEDRISVIFHEEYRNQHAHHHDARMDRCSVCLHAARDGLGNID
jgi:hypothetical protein